MLVRPQKTRGEYGRLPDRLFPCVPIGVHSYQPCHAMEASNEIKRPCIQQACYRISDERVPGFPVKWRFEMEGLLAGRIALITGGASGLGRVLVRMFIEEVSNVSF